MYYLILKSEYDCRLKSEVATRRAFTILLPAPVFFQMFLATLSKRKALQKVKQGKIPNGGSEVRSLYRRLRGAGAWQTVAGSIKQIFFLLLNTRLVINHLKYQGR